MGVTLEIKENKHDAAIKNKGLKSTFSINNSKVKDVREFNKKDKR